MKKILYTFLLLGVIAILSGCKEDSYEDLIPQKYEKILYLKNNGQQNLQLFNDGTNTDYTVVVGKTGSNPAATAQAQLKVMTQEEVDKDDHYTGNNYVVLSSKCYIYQTQQLDFNSSETYKSIFLKLVPAKISEEVHASQVPNAIFILPLRLTSKTDSVNTEMCDLILKPRVTDLGIAFKKGSKNVNMNASSENVSVVEVEIAMTAGVQNTWNFTAGIELQSTPEILDEYNTANKTSYLMIPNDAVEGIEDAVFENGSNESAGTISIMRDKLSKGQTYLVPLKLKPIEEYANIMTSSKLFYGIIEYPLDMVTDKITLTETSFHDGYGWLPQDQFKNLLDNDNSTHFESKYGVITGNSTYGTPLDVKIGKEVNSIMFRYVTRGGGNTNPADITLYVSNNDEVLTNPNSSTWTKLAVPADLIPRYTEKATYTSKVFSSNTKFKYLRVAVKMGNGPVDGTATATGNCWGMAEFSLWAY